MRRVLLAAALLTAASVIGVPAAHADPPAPPTPPGCRSCGGPPVPPTPVPTLGQSAVPVEHVVSVELAPVHVKRGGTTRASITATSDDRVTLVVHYHRGKPVTYRATIGASGKLVKRWKVPRHAPLGKAAVKVTVDGTGDPYRTTVTLLVTR